MLIIIASCFLLILSNFRVDWFGGVHYRKENEMNMLNHTS